MQITVCTSFSIATSSEEKRLLPIMKAAGIKPE
jgi:hypothetical protein